LKNIIIHTVLFIMFTLFMFSCTQKADALIEKRLSGELVVKEIIKDCFLITHSYPWPGNSLIVKLDQKDFIWIDTPYTPQATAMVLDWLYKKYGEHISIKEINTGFHIDNLGGNQELKKRGIPIYGSTMTCKLLREKSKNTMQKFRNWLKAAEYKKYYDTYSNFIFIEPTIVFDLHREQTIECGKEKVEIYYPGPTHTYDNITVYIPSKKLLFGGCMILSQEAHKIGFAEDGNVKEWPKSLHRVMQKYKKIDIVVPGHGNAGDKSLIQHTIDIIEQS